MSQNNVLTKTDFLLTFFFAQAKVSYLSNPEEVMTAGGHAWDALQRLTPAPSTIIPAKVIPNGG